MRAAFFVTAICGAQALRGDDFRKPMMALKYVSNISCSNLPASVNWLAALLNRSTIPAEVGTVATSGAPGARPYLMGSMPSTGTMALEPEVPRDASAACSVEEPESAAAEVG